jgi:four helix bundle protein
MVCDFKQLEVWKKAVELAVEIHQITNAFPKSEAYGLTDQIRRATNSISANIAEGSGKFTEADFARYLSISLGSCKEVENHLVIAHKLGYLQEDGYQNVGGKVQEVGKMLNGLIKRVRSRL